MAVVEYINTLRIMRRIRSIKVLIGYMFFINPMINTIMIAFSKGNNRGFINL